MSTVKKPRDRRPWAFRRGGVTGSHAGLRILCRKACGFDSRPRHLPERSSFMKGLLMNSRSMLPFVVAALAAWSLTASPASAQTTLRYKFKEGDNLKYTIDQKMKMTMNIGGNAIDMNMNQSSDMTWTIKNVDSDGNAKITVKFGRNKMTMDGPQGTTQVDSDSTTEPDDPIGQILYKVIKGLAGLEMEATISATGEYSDIKVPEKAVKELQNLPGGEMFGDMFSA